MKPDRWIIGGLAVGFVVSNIGIAVFGWTDYWQYQVLLAGPLLAAFALVLWRSRRDNANPS